MRKYKTQTTKEKGHGPHALAKNISRTRRGSSTGSLLLENTCLRLAWSASSRRDGSGRRCTRPCRTARACLRHLSWVRLHVSHACATFSGGASAAHSRCRPFRAPPFGFRNAHQRQVLGITRLRSACADECSLLLAAFRARRMSCASQEAKYSRTCSRSSVSSLHQSSDSAAFHP